MVKTLRYAQGDINKKGFQKMILETFFISFLNTSSAHIDKPRIVAGQVCGHNRDTGTTDLQ